MDLRRLRSAAVAALAGGVAALCGCGETTDVGGRGERIAVEAGAPAMHVVVAGSDYEMGWHHGRLLREDVRRLVAEWLEAALRGRPAEPGRASLEERCRLYASLMKPLLPESVVQELRGLSEGSGVSQDDLLLVEAMREGLRAEGAARPLFARIVVAGPWARAAWSGPDAPIWKARTLVLERRPHGRRATMSLCWPGALGALAVLSDAGVLAVAGEVALDFEARESLQGVPFAVGLRHAAERADDAQALLDRLPRTTGHRVAVLDTAGSRVVGTLARVAPPEAVLRLGPGQIALAEAPGSLSPGPSGFRLVEGRGPDVLAPSPAEPSAGEPAVYARLEVGEIHVPPAVYRWSSPPPSSGGVAGGASGGGGSAGATGR